MILLARHNRCLDIEEYGCSLFRGENITRARLSPYSWPVQILLSAKVYKIYWSKPITNIGDVDMRKL